MVDAKSVRAQLKRIKFDTHLWGRAEAQELSHILTPDEKIAECVNGLYEGGFALLCATNMRLLLVDKKPLNFLNVEDMRFDMINEIDYSHRLFGAHITISAGSKTLKFRSYNQQRLRKLISHVQHRMLEIKQEESSHADDQKQHLQEINNQLQVYLLAQHRQQELLRQQLEAAKVSGQAPVPDLPKPSPELSDYLLAQSLLQKLGDNRVAGSNSQAQDLSQSLEGDNPIVPAPQSSSPITGEEEKDGPYSLPKESKPNVVEQPVPSLEAAPPKDNADLYIAGYREIFGKRPAAKSTRQKAETAKAHASSTSFTGYIQSKLPSPPKIDLTQLAAKSLEINPLKIAYAKLPMALRNRRLHRRPSLHVPAPSQANTTQQQTPAAT